jgi:hypothetical protein
MDWCCATSVGSERKKLEGRAQDLPPAHWRAVRAGVERAIAACPLTRPVASSMAWTELCVSSTYTIPRAMMGAVEHIPMRSHRDLKARHTRPPEVLLTLALVMGESSVYRELL